MADPFLNSRPNKIVGLAARYAIPAMYPWREFPMAGALMSYGTELADAWRQIGVYGGKILKGAKPGDLPVQQYAASATTIVIVDLCITRSHS
jgi:putative tryptophan/tyrosine transport system substrate-binding protein